ncbi:hypothetical protein E3E38_06010 [Thermococcus sp. 18S1]|uniref:hypothetical protein n=1 Tax=Thermococcus sp. 18S1 TaxID=1638210 RepID=UPI00143B21A9|nr:hypothetical protein [Thermococcus sp. 18S1]NJE30601.1 hypothetical protein [Thermococcus sp. 18S1]
MAGVKANTTQKVEVKDTYTSYEEMLDDVVAYVLQNVEGADEYTYLASAEYSIHSGSTPYDQLFAEIDAGIASSLYNDVEDFGYIGFIEGDFVSLLEEYLSSFVDAMCFYDNYDYHVEHLDDVFDGVYVDCSTYEHYLDHRVEEYADIAGISPDELTEEELSDLSWDFKVEALTVNLCFSMPARLVYKEYTENTDLCGCVSITFYKQNPVAVLKKLVEEIKNRRGE